MPLLISAKGDGWTLEIVGKLPTLPPFIKAVPESCILVSGVVTLYVIDVHSGEMVLLDPGISITPIFYEHVDYDIYFEKSSDVTLSLPSSAEARRINKNNEHYQINFGNNVGFADISINSKVSNSVLQIEIFSRKIDYRTDYLKMRHEVSGVLRNLAMTANAKTYGLSAPSPAAHPTLLEWFALIRTNFKELIKLTQAISKKPHSRLESHNVKKNTDRVRRASRQTINRALRGGGGGGGFLLQSIGVMLPSKLDEQVSLVSFDTSENRYYKGLLRVTYRNILALTKVRVSEDEDGERDSEKQFFNSIRADLDTMKTKIEVALRAPFLNTVGEATLNRPASMVFHKNPIYSRVDQLARILNGGLSFTGDIVPIGVKNTALLYEYWCFLKIVDLLRERFDLVEQSVVKINNFRTSVCLAKGKTSAMRFTHKATKKDLYLVYNRLFNRLPTLSQQPDNVIQLASNDRFYIFDAKYRIQFDKEYLNAYGCPGPMTTDINTMHRYRDAIAIPHPMKPNEYVTGVVKGAVVLFPYPDEVTYQEHKFYKSIEKVEIGGIPFLPSTTAMMAKKLNSLLVAEFPEIL